jgi:hypothetical protein
MLEYARIAAFESKRPRFGAASDMIFTFRLNTDCAVMMARVT